MPKKKKGHIDLLEGCYCTEISVTPANWDRGGASVKTDWSIWYRFYDPAFKDHPQFGNGKLCIYRGMNGFRSLGDRRAITKELLAQHEEEVYNKGWNPVRKVYMKPQTEDFDYIIHPDTGLNEALSKAKDRLCKNPATTDDMKINLTAVLKYFKKAALAAMQSDRPISQVKRRHMVMCWEQLAIVKGSKWTDNAHNYYRTHMMILFKELYKVETIEVIPMGSIPVKTIIREKRETLTMEQRRKIDSGLRQDNYRLWLFMQVFFHSGARTTELLDVKAADVDLVNLRVRYTIKKGRGGNKRTIYRPIKTVAVSFWLAALEGAKPDEYLFSKGLVPGARSIRREQITRRWRTWVKKKYEVTADFYSLKHSNTTEIVDQVGNVAAARLTGHTSTEMIDKIYDVGKEDRETDAVRGAANVFA